MCFCNHSYYWRTKIYNFFSRSLLEIKASTRKLCGLAVTDLIVVS